MGSKNLYAKQLCSVLPSGKRLVDLFAGGCAITDCAIREYRNKWDTFLVNDINPEPLDLYAKCLCGNNPVSYEWVTREEFKHADFATKLCRSFGNNLDKYIFGKDIEPLKHDLEEWLVSGTVLGLSGIFDGIELPELSSRQERMVWWKEHKKELPRINVRANRLEQIGRLDRLQLENFARLERLERLEFSYLSYEQYTYRDGDVVYCDIPYRDTYCVQYKANKNGFNHEAFWEWAKSCPFDVYVSDRIIPNNLNAEIMFQRDIPKRASDKGATGHVTEYLVRV